MGRAVPKVVLFAFPVRAGPHPPSERSRRVWDSLDFLRMLLQNLKGAVQDFYKAARNLIELETVENESEAPLSESSVWHNPPQLGRFCFDH